MTTEENSLEVQLLKKFYDAGLELVFERDSSFQASQKQMIFVHDRHPLYLAAIHDNSYTSVYVKNGGDDIGFPLIKIIPGRIDVQLVARFKTQHQQPGFSLLEMGFSKRIDLDGASHSYFEDNNDQKFISYVHHRWDSRFFRGLSSYPNPIDVEELNFNISRRT